MIRLLLLLLLLFPCPAPAAGLHLDGALTQGGLLRGQAPVGSRVFYGDRPLKLSKNGDFILGFARDAKLQQSLTLITPEGAVETRDLRLSPRHYQIERIDGISRKMMAPDPDNLRRIRQEASQAKAARQRDSELNNFTEAFIWPVTGRISGVYGSQRILNGEPRRPHYGVDIAAPTGTPVKAPAGGRVSLAHPGMFFSGRTLILDHGHGLSSSFLHLSRIRVEPGQRVRQGDIIAEVGASGRVTGPHLDWRLNWFDVRLDPALLVPEMPKNPREKH